MTHILIVQSPYYQTIAAELVRGATAALAQKGATYEIVEVPGAFEIPAAVAYGIESGRFEGYVALGCVIRGETTHYDYVCGESARGLMELAITRHAAIGYGILTVENEDQAIMRARVEEGNKGGEAAHTALHMAALKARLRGRI